MKVVFFSHSAGLYGAERSLLDIILGVSVCGVEPIVILPEYGLFTEELEKNNIRYIVYPYYGWLGRRHKMIKGIYRFMVNKVAVKRLATILRSDRVDLVYSNTLAISIGAMVAKYIGVKHVWHVREFIHEDMGCDFDFGSHWASNFVIRNSSYIVYNSLAVKNKFSCLFGTVPGEVVYNGWLPEEPCNDINIRPLQPDKPIKLCIVGSLHCGKRQHEAISALSILIEKFPHITLNIVGSGNAIYIKELKRLCSRYNLSKSIFWAGYVNDTSEVFAESDITLVCSGNEAFGRVVVESMAEGCPVVAVRSGGIPEIIIHGKNGLMYNSESRGDLVRQVTLLINDAELHSSIVQQGIIDVYNRFNRKKLEKNIFRIMKNL